MESGPGPVTGPPLETRRLRLRTVATEDIPFLHEVETGPRTGWRFRYRGSVPTLEQYARDLGYDVLSAFTIDDKKAQARVGIVACYWSNLQDGHAHVAVVTAPAYEGTGWGMEAMIVFMNYLFQIWNFRKLYANVLEFNLPQFKSGIDKGFRVEGVLKQHHYYAGKHWDQYMLGVYRDEWLAEYGPTLESLRAKPA
jgi:RimJ/RimL family protein N-acetyltransferase